MESNEDNGIKFKISKINKFNLQLFLKRNLKQKFIICRQINCFYENNKQEVNILNIKQIVFNGYLKINFILHLLVPSAPHI